MVQQFLWIHGQHIHALEINGLRAWNENLGVVSLGERLGIPEERWVVTIGRYGNTSAASIPLALADAEATGRQGPGTTVLMSGFGGGMTWGSALLRY
jgi:3-oxoacyl-[acyl-carrier-protein] synthase III